MLRGSTWTTATPARLALYSTKAPSWAKAYWQRTWRGAEVWETGWAVLPEFQGRGLAARAARAVTEAARDAGPHRYLHAFPSIDHAASNAVCRRAGFTLLGQADFEYPKGHWIRSNDWRMDLRRGD
ncbi:GNAT family N-acetyltransferase [Streptomyces sp. NPDC057381]|uniref:GNAT family N-acetyltransferase n=1 Tax=Streptomyces sp. NPDC057381 TaxID=3346111 RepID=UPI003633D25C